MLLFAFFPVPHQKTYTAINLNINFWGINLPLIFLARKPTLFILISKDKGGASCIIGKALSSVKMHLISIQFTSPNRGYRRSHLREGHTGICTDLSSKSRTDISQGWWGERRKMPRQCQSLCLTRNEEALFGLPSLRPIQSTFQQICLWQGPRDKELLFAAGMLKLVHPRTKTSSLFSSTSHISRSHTWWNTYWGMQYSSTNPIFLERTMLDSYSREVCCCMSMWEAQYIGVRSLGDEDHRRYLIQEGTLCSLLQLGKNESYFWNHFSYFSFGKFINETQRQIKLRNGMPKDTKRWQIIKHHNLSFLTPMSIIFLFPDAFSNTDPYLKPAQSMCRTFILTWPWCGHPCHVTAHAAGKSPCSVLHI